MPMLPSVSRAIALTGALLWSMACLAQSQSPAPQGHADEFFEIRIRPLLSKNCFACHTGSRMGGLQVDSREHLLAGGKDGPALIPYHPKESLLIQAVSQTNANLKMPPQGKLKDEDIEALTAWVMRGAVWPVANVIEPGATKKGEYV